MERWYATRKRESHYYEWHHVKIESDNSKRKRKAKERKHEKNEKSGKIKFQSCNYTEIKLNDLIMLYKLRYNKNSSALSRPSIHPTHVFWYSATVAKPLTTQPPISTLIYTETASLFYFNLISISFSLFFLVSLFFVLEKNWKRKKS